MLAKKLPINNKKTGMAHTGLLPTFIAGFCFLLIKFDIVSPQKLTSEVITVIITLVGIAVMWWNNWRTPKRS